MHIYTALQIGHLNSNRCEDFFLVDHLGARFVIGAVMDGCTMGTDSHFASTLTGKLLRKVLRQRQELEHARPETQATSATILLRSVFIELMTELTDMKNRLLLDNDELLTTLVLLVVDTQENNGMLVGVGDGYVVVNGTVTAYDHDNRSDYLGFHLADDAATWYDSLPQKMELSSIEDITIATHGLGSFTELTADAAPAIDPIAFLTIDQQGKDHPDMPEKKLKTLEHQFGLKPGDDLALIRLIR
ncbi:protein phosphatase 2C domain-containing protein [Paraflavitalea pollutisoli]|uniref:protein phosphatase 2C domain-containing protein n=1 Tax=Paraflavitalea pollutisoli TaxID=3034143 RepID=UPI0023EE03E9|nr:protein phosphatase 2C domain-containing protein [Paraflavitalea sp. H1-2-19X]